jgi:hypothetical protein
LASASFVVSPRVSALGQFHDPSDQRIVHDPALRRRA